MTAYTIIPDTSIDGDSVADVALMTAMRDNPLAIAEGDATAPAITKVQLGSTSTAGTQSVGDNSTKIATTAFCEAGFVNNDVGSVGIGGMKLGKYNATSVNPDATVSGANVWEYPYTATQTLGAGTWKNISDHGLNGSITTAQFQRIS